MILSKNMKKPKAVRSVNEVQIIEIRGPWASKSGGDLNVLFNLDHAQVTAFLDYDNPEFDSMPGDMRGLRSYKVENVPKGSIGAKECHIARNEIVFAAKGSFSWKCIDLHGNEKEFILDGKTAVITPSGLLHIYEALEDDSTIQVVCNTGFAPEDPATHDSYSIDDFYALQAEIATDK